MKSHTIALSFMLWLAVTGSVTAGTLEILAPWVRKPSPSMQAIPAYMVLRNPSFESKAIVAVTSPLFAKVEIHETIIQGSRATMFMRKRVSVSARSQRHLKPGGYHLMLIAPLGSRSLRVGQRVPLILSISDGSQRWVDAVVR